MTPKANRQVGIWLIVGVFMLFFQIVIGGITRLTESGLSITEWEVVTGTLPPLSQDAWQQEFNKYKQTPQYHKINQDITFSEFQFIYFWEYVHRLWGRIMGVVFIIPFGIFLFQKKLSSSTIGKLLVVIILGALVGSFGWIMVVSGLKDRPWVDAYKLTVHLLLGALTYGYVLWLAMSHLSYVPLPSTSTKKLWQFSILITGMISIQLATGGLMSGMKAALFYPTFPDLNGHFIPPVLTDVTNWSLEAFRQYDEQPLAVAFVQFVHRMLAYFIIIVVGFFIYKGLQHQLPQETRNGLYALGITVLVQIVLGIVTLLTTSGHVPVLWGVLHQAGSIFVLTSALYLNYHLMPNFR